MLEHLEYSDSCPRFRKILRKHNMPVLETFYNIFTIYGRYKEKNMNNAINGHILLNEIPYKDVKKLTLNFNFLSANEFKIMFFAIKSENIGICQGKKGFRQKIIHLVAFL